MATANKKPRRTPPSNASREAEIERLTREQQQDNDARRVRRERPRRYEKDAYGDEEHSARQLPWGQTRLQGEELREHVVWLAQRELDAAGLQIPSDLVADFARRRRASQRRGVDQQAAKLQRAIAAAVERAERFVEQHRPRSGGAQLAELAETIAALRAARMPYESLAALKQSINRAPGTARRLAEPVVDPDDPPRVVLVEQLQGDEWTDRLLACASLVLGCWPSTLEDDEPIAPAGVLQIERETMGKARQRHVPK